MRKVRCGRDLLCMFPGAAAAAASSCLSCIGKNTNFLIKGEENENEFGEIKPLISTTYEKSAALKVKDVIAPTSTLAFHLKPKVRISFLVPIYWGCRFIYRWDWSNEDRTPSVPFKTTCLCYFILTCIHECAVINRTVEILINVRNINKREIWSCMVYDSSPFLV